MFRVWVTRGRGLRIVLTELSQSLIPWPRHSQHWPSSLSASLSFSLVPFCFSLLILKGFFIVWRHNTNPTRPCKKRLYLPSTSFQSFLPLTSLTSFVTLILLELFNYLSPPNPFILLSSVFLFDPLPLCLGAFGQDHDQSEKLIKQGDQEVVAGKYERAIDLYTDALNSDSTNMRAYYKRATAKHLSNQISGALRDLQMALAQQPDYYLARFFRAKINKEMGNFEQAVADLEQIVKDVPADSSNSKKAKDELMTVTAKRDRWNSIKVPFDLSLPISHDLSFLPSSYSHFHKVFLRNPC